jgi:uncharacterized radical SAM superfamily Fe-S cluster-containing enzyme
MSVILQSETLLKHTRSRCPVCDVSAPAEVWRRCEGKSQTVWLRRRCPEHGIAENCISSDARFYWLAQGDPRNGGCACSSGDGGYEGTLGRNAAVAKDEGRRMKDEIAPVSGVPPSTFSPQPSAFSRLSTCLALIEIVNSCNLACPTCYADSPIGASGARLDAVPLADLQRRIQGIIDRKGRIEILQLSGGEPTLHPEFFKLLEWAQANPGIDYLLINTNGVRLANDPDFATRLGKTFHYGGLQLYLQFDGVQESGQHALRGLDLRALRERAIARAGELNLPLTLAMTVTSDNLAHLWETIEFGLKHPHIRGVSFQPLFTSGRLPPSTISRQPSAPLNTADIILACVEQSAGTIKFEDFTPLPCGDPNCATIGYLLKTPGGVRSISDFVDFAQVQGFLRDKVRYSLDDLAQCGCESEPLGHLLHDFELNETSCFRLFIKPFMDAWTWDEDRIDRCCTHVIRPDGELDSFCRYYANGGPNASAVARRPEP